MSSLLTHLPDTYNEVDLPDEPPPPDRPRRRGIALLAAGLAVVVVLAWVSPPVQRWSRGPTAEEVALQTEQARADDLKRRLDDEIARNTRGRAVPADPSAARADDLSGQVGILSAILRRGKPPVVDKVAAARAADLARQKTVLEQKAMGPHPQTVDPTQQIRADDLKRQLDDEVAKNSRPRPTVDPPVTASLTKDQILASRNLFGMYTQQSPFSYAEVDLVQGDVNRKANLVGYFQSWLDPFRVDALEDTWRHGQIPLMTWEPQAQVGVVSAVDADFSLPTIIGGRWDDYIRSYATGIAARKLPVVIRLAHEMNGSWYPWSEVRGWDGTPINGNNRGDYVRMWRHVHDIFQAAGANDYTIWLWAPNRVNKIPHQPPPADFYPGDDVVDWIGLSGYNRPDDPAPTFDDTFGQTLPLLRAAGTRPLFLAEIGATEDGGHKPEWIRDLFAGLARNPDIVGFSWFNLTVTSGETNDWRIDSSGPSIRAMKEGLVTAGWGLPGG